MKKIFIFVSSIFNRRDYKRFGVEILKSRGFEVHVWDFSPMLSKLTFNPPDPIKYNNYKLISEQSDFNKISNRLNNSTVICHIGYKSETKFIFNYFNNNKISFGFCGLGEIPENPRSVLNKIISGFQNPHLIKSKIKLLIRRMVTNRIYPIYPNFIIMGGEKSYKSNRYLKNSSTKIIKSHALDYDLYLNEEDKKSERIVNGDYAVFLDEFICFHPDNYEMNIKQDCSSEDYYPDINRFFDKVESEFDTKVVIAVYPRSDYQSRGNLFNTRQCVINETINLVKYSKFVIGHASTSTNFAILYNKPMVFITSHKYEVRYNNKINYMASVLGKKPINICNSSIDIYSGLKVDESLYKSFKEKYIKTPDTPERPVWEIFADNID